LRTSKRVIERNGDAAREAGLNKGEAVKEEEAPETVAAPVAEKPRKKSKEKQ